LPYSPKGRGQDARASRTAQGSAVARLAQQRREAQDKRAIRAAFSFVHFFWPNKRNGPQGAGAEPPAFFYTVIAVGDSEN